MKVAVIIPVFNHVGTIEQVVMDVRAVVGGDMEMIVVDDGCTDGSTEVMRRLSGITLLTHPRNLGKGHALVTGFQRARDSGCTHAVTVDADGQHWPADVAGVLAAAREHSEDLVIGHRDLDAAHVPARSRKGRDAATFWLRVQTGQQIPDSQCGLRVYPLEVLELKYRFWRFDFETEVLARMAWAGVRILSVPVKCIYFPGKQRVSHFRPVVDTLRGVRVNVFLVARRLLPIPFKQLHRQTEEKVVFGAWWRPASWKRAIRDALCAGSSNAELAIAFAMGIFVGLTPFYGLQTLLAIYFSRRLHLNVVAAVIGSQVSMPPLVPIWWVVSYGVGNLLLHGHWLAGDLRTFSREMVPAMLLGGLLVAFGAALAGLLVARAVLHVFRTDTLAHSHEAA